MKKSRTMIPAVALLVAMVPFAAAGQDSPLITFCDDFGGVWNVAAVTCPEVAGGSCISGTRFTASLPTCGFSGNGNFLVYGSYVDGVLSVTSFDAPEDDCISVSWTCTVSGACEGVWHNETDGTGTFTFNNCRAGAPVRPDLDPNSR